MKVLLDEDSPRKLKRLLVGHKAHTVQDMRWGGTQNGELLRRAEAAGFEALVTFDQDFPYQQNIARSGLALVIFVVPDKKIPTLLPHISELIAVILERATPGQVYIVPTLTPGA